MTPNAFVTYVCATVLLLGSPVCVSVHVCASLGSLPEVSTFEFLVITHPLAQRTFHKILLNTYTHLDVIPEHVKYWQCEVGNTS